LKNEACYWDTGISLDNTDLQRHIEERGINAEILSMSGRVHSVEAASTELGVPPENFIKTVVFVSEGKAILAIVKGTDRASSKRIAKALNSTPPKLATPNEALDFTGYAVGGTPPISISGVQVLVDPDVMDMPEVVGGGGSDMHLLRIRPEDIVKDNEAKVVRVRK
jgi:prolyl-tRNA editing enzyme YbaK/EbsC (Cys-tRNA(Pro) deacylase)